jgi:hypothetical protein
MANDMVSYAGGDFAADGRNLPVANPDSAPVNPLDSGQNAQLLAKLEDWWTEARDLHAENRREQIVDADYRDGDQWKLEDAAHLEDRGQAALRFPLVKQMVDWVKGTERRTRVDWNVLPRSEEDVDMAQLKKELLKYISDVNAAGWERSRAFGDAVDVGVGWIEDCYNNDEFEEPITTRYQDWKGMWWDPYSRCNVLRDCRYLIRGKYLDLDYSQAMFPDRAEQLRHRAYDFFDPQLEQLDLENSLPQMFYGSTLSRSASAMSGTFSLSGTSLMSRRTRPRILGLETWFRLPVPAQKLRGDAQYRGQVYDPTNVGQQQAIESGVCSLVDSVSEEMHCAIWTPGLLLSVRKSPYKHNRFPFTPCWGYRRHRDGMPYGLIRLARDSQDEYNKRRSKALFLLSSERIIYESDAFNEGDENTMLEEARRPDGEVRVKPGALAEKKFEIQTNRDLANGHIELMQEAKANIYELSGVTRENTGQDSGALSGIAIRAKQQQGSVTTAELFDNQRQSVQESGVKQLSNVEQFMSLPKKFRILGPAGAAKFVTLNEPTIDENGQVIFNNDVTKTEADFIVDEMNYHETMRMAMAEQVFDSLKGLPPETALQLLDMAFELTDLPNKDVFAQRIRQLNGMPEPGQEKDPQYIAQKKKEAADAQNRQRLQDENLAADTQVKLATADQHRAAAKEKGVTGKEKALNLAAVLEAASPLAPAADRLYDPDQSADREAPPPHNPNPETP